MEIRQIPLSLVFPSPMNPRKTFNGEDLQELSDNIERQGLLQPITVRPVKHPSNEFHDRPDKYEIICGERRYRAFLQLSEKWSAMDCVAPEGQSYNRFSEIPAIIREMNDDEAFDAMITENLQRQDVDPMEEAFAFLQLTKKGSSVQDIALRFGKSVRFVQDRIKLNALVPELMKAVKEDDMPISAAMIICKVSDDQQRQYYKQYSNHYQGLTTATASSFVKAMFLKVEDAVWDSDFTGGCDVSCGKCSYNTCNHGCLFYEMKSDDGRCTNEERYIVKTVAYIEQYLKSIDNQLVKSGQPLEKGKMVIAYENDKYAPDNVKRIKKAIFEKVEELGYKLVDPLNKFDRSCYYDIDDERAQNFLKSGECYRVLHLTDYSNIRIKQRAWYVRSDDKTTNVDNVGAPLKVRELVNKYKSEKSMLSARYTVGKCKALAEHGEIKDLKGLDDTELKLVCAMMIKGNRDLCGALRIGDYKNNFNYPEDEEITAYAENHLEMLPFIVRSWIKHALSVRTNIITGTEMCALADPFADRLGETWCPEKYSEAQEKIKAKFEKTEKKIAAQLKEMGFDLDGKKIEPETSTRATAPARMPLDIEKQYKEMKKKHPDSLLLFRIGDFYETFDDDAEKASKVLGITITKRGKMMLAGFPYQALDTYLPKLTRAGHRVAICEQLEKPKK